MSISFSFKRQAKATGSLYDKGVYPPAFSEEFKESIRERDGRCCAICGVTEQKLGHHLDVHHINYTKYTVRVNCISLCRECHTTVHNNHHGQQYRYKEGLYRIACEREHVVTLEDFNRAWGDEEHAR